MWRPVIATLVPPEAEPIDTAAAKRHLRVDHADEDEAIDGFIAAARGAVEAMTGLRVMPQTVAVSCDRWSDLAHLPVAPVKEVLEVAYTDLLGNEQMLPAEAYDVELSGLAPGLTVRSPPVRRPGTLIRIKLLVGADDPAPEVLQAIRVLLTEYFDRGDGTKSAPALANILANHTLY